MKFRVWNKELTGFIKGSNWYMNGDGELFYEDVMDGGLIKSTPGSYIIEVYDENPITYDGKII